MTKNNNFDCGVFAMLHMETYIGQPEGKWDCELPVESEEQNAAMWKLRMRFASKILTHEMNIYSNMIIRYANSFVNKHTREEIKAIVRSARANRDDRVRESTQ